MLAEALARIDAIDSIEDEGELSALDQAVQTVLASPDARLGIRTLLRVFERFPTADGYGIFWSILHGLEGMPGPYEAELVESVRRAPGEFSLTMLNRMLNAGEIEVVGTRLLDLLEEVSRREDCPTEVRRRAQKFHEHQQRKNPGPHP
jgi:hypothetical protein